MTRTAALCAALLLAALAAPAEETKGLKVPFVEGRPFAEMLKRAKAEKKPLLVDVYAVWCGPCKQLDRLTFSDQGFADWAKAKVVPVKIDAEKGEGRSIARRYAITSFPTVLFVSPDGVELDRVSGVLDPARFKEVGDLVLAGKTPLLSALAELAKSWDAAKAASVATTLGQRNDVRRLRPLARRFVEEDPDLADPGARDTFYYLVALEDAQEDVSAETLDVLATIAPRLKGDPREGPLYAAAAREYVRRGDAPAARAAAKAGLAAVGDASPLAPELHSVLGQAERKAGRFDAAIASGRRAVELCDTLKMSPALRAFRGMELAETLAEAGKADEAKKEVAASLERINADAGLLSRASTVLLKAKDVPGALARSRRAVELSQGGDARAQAALGSALSASGDAAGAVAALERAAELDPASADYKRRLQEAKRKKPAAKAG